jgi:uncharacterized protein
LRAVQTLSRSQARRLALGAQGFGGKRPPGRIDRRHLRSMMQRLELLQLDSVPAVVRTQYMPFFSRLGVYRRDLLDEIAYVDDAWFEAWSHEASLLPVETEPFLRWHKQRSAEGETWKGLVRLAKEEPQYIQSVLDEIAERGPMSASQLSDPRPQSGQWWGSRSLGQLALTWLWRTGAVGIRRTRNFEKEFDLFERVIPDDIRAVPTPAEPDALKELLRRSAMALGVGTADCIVDYFRVPPRRAKPLIPELVENGELIECRIEGWDKPAFRHPDVAMPRRIHRATLLSPFDPIVWNRPRALGLFDFHYRIEIYTPAAKRQFGYYVLPLLVGERVVGRFDLKTLRDEGLLHVKASFIEDGVDAAEIAPLARAELERLAEFVGADGLKIERRGNLKL